MHLGGLATHLLHLSSLIPPQRFSHISNMPTLQDFVAHHTPQDIMIIMAEQAPHMISCEIRIQTKCILFVFGVRFN